MMQSSVSLVQILLESLLFTTCSVTLPFSTPTEFLVHTKNSLNYRWSAVVFMSWCPALRREGDGPQPATQCVWVWAG